MLSQYSTSRPTHHCHLLYLLHHTTSRMTTFVHSAGLSCTGKQSAVTTQASAFPSLHVFHFRCTRCKLKCWLTEAIMDVWFRSGTTQASAFPSQHVFYFTCTRCKLKCWLTKAIMNDWFRVKKLKEWDQFQISMVGSLVRLPFRALSCLHLSPATHAYTQCHTYMYAYSVYVILKYVPLSLTLAQFSASQPNDFPCQPQTTEGRSMKSIWWCR